MIGGHASGVDSALGQQRAKVAAGALRLRAVFRRLLCCGVQRLRRRRRHRGRARAGGATAVGVAQERHLAAAALQRGFELCDDGVLLRDDALQRARGTRFRAPLGGGRVSRVDGPVGGGLRAARVAR